ncbi:MAG: hypothetical protein ACKOAX_03805, partial [Candidatus Kapaibacterium sp.]
CSSPGSSTGSSTGSSMRNAAGTTVSRRNNGSTVIYDSPSPSAQVFSPACSSTSASCSPLPFRSMRVLHP